MATVTAELEEEGVKAFADAFTDLIAAIEDRRKTAVAELGPYRNMVPAEIVRHEHQQTSRRIFDIDPTLWTDDPAGQEEVKKRMGWLVSPQTSRHLVMASSDLAASCQKEGLTHALLLGMGGSSLAPEVLSLTFGTGKIDGRDALSVNILDSTDPAQVLAAETFAPLEKTLFIVSSKSGGTSEVMAYLDYFWAKAGEKLGDAIGSHFIAITDPGTHLEKLASERKFRAIFSGDPQVGGRYSALTAFGLVPAALLGIDLDQLLDKGERMMNQCLPGIPAGRNPGLVLGTIIGMAGNDGRNKLTILTDGPFTAFGSWLEQLLAESTGKIGRGIVPVDIEPEIATQDYGKDRLFVYIRSNGEKDEFVKGLQAAGQPVLTFHVDSPYDLGTEFYRWEMATAVASALLKVNGFDQPDVQDNKTRTANKIKAYQEKGALEEGQAVWESKAGQVFGDALVGIKNADSLKGAVKALLATAKEGDYIAINAYVPRNEKNLEKLQALRKSVLESTHCATTLGFGPRFLHSTGQLHKGGPDSSVFLQITHEPETDLDIPTEGLTFGTLERAQALGDLETLQSRGRRVIRVHLTGAGIEDLFNKRSIKKGEGHLAFSFF